MPADLVPADQKSNPAAIQAADYLPLTRDALRTAIPGIKGRGPERTLTRLVSSGAADDLRSRVTANPALIGTTIKTPLLLSDDADLYFKGAGTPITARPGRGTATPSGTTGAITITTSAADFSENLVTLKLAMAERARALTAEAQRLSRSTAADAAARVTALREEAAALTARAGGSQPPPSNSTAGCRRFWSRSMAASSRSASSPPTASRARSCCRSRRRAKPSPVIGGS